MKIALCGSFSFAQQMIDVSKELTMIGHEPLLASDIDLAVKDPSISVNVDWCIQNDVIRDQLAKILNSDAILVLNYNKKGIDGYVGGSSLIEIGFAHFYRKKIFLLYDIPDMSYGVEIKIMQPIIIHGDLKKISQSI